MVVRDWLCICCVVFHCRNGVLWLTLHMMCRLSMSKWWSGIHSEHDASSFIIVMLVWGWLCTCCVVFLCRNGGLGWLYTSCVVFHCHNGCLELTLFMLCRLSLSLWWSGIHSVYDVSSFNVAMGVWGWLCTCCVVFIVVMVVWCWLCTWCVVFHCRNDGLGLTMYMLCGL